MKTSIRILFCSALPTIALAAMANTTQAAAPSAAVTATGFYDPASQTLQNNVDTNAPGIPITAGTGNGPIAPVGAFNTAILAAFTAGRGGVIDFDSPLALGTYSGITASYAGGTKSLSISTSSLFETSTGFVQGDGAPTSGTQYGESVGAPPFTLTFNSITGASLGETGVVAAGITLLSANDPTIFNAATALNYGPVTVTAKFSDNSTFVATRTINDLKGQGDTFYSAVAPAGLTITSLTISDSNTFFLVPEFDDLAFATTVIPEPSTAALIALAIPALLARTRRSPRLVIATR